LARLTADLRPCVLATLDYVVQRTYALPASRQDFEHNMLRLHKLVEELVEAIRAAHATGRLGSDRSPVIDLVTHGTEQRTLTARELFPFLLVALIAGHETTGHTMAWAIDHLGRDPDLLHRVRTEVDAFYAAQPGRVLGATDCRDRPWTQALLYEIGRFHPPLIAVPRSASADGEIAPDPATGSPGFRYRKDTAFICSIIGVHRDPKRWKEPERFRPERFFDQPGERVSPAESGRRVWDHARSRERDYDLLTFSAGTGRCLGQDFNMLEFFLVLDFLLRRYDVELVNPKRVVRDSTDVISGPEPGSIIVRIGRRAGILAGASG
jgi:cytochrome P450